MTFPARAMSIPDEKFYRAHITKRVDFAPDLWMFRIRSGGEFNFVPGQYATLGVENNGKRLERPYSIASSPAEDEVEFFFELVPQGALTPLLHKMQPGDQLLMRKAPKGKFSLDMSNGRNNHLLISTVTGVAPFVSYVRTLWVTHRRQMTFSHAAAAFLKVLRQQAANQPNSEAKPQSRQR